MSPDLLANTSVASVSSSHEGTNPDKRLPFDELKTVRLFFFVRHVPYLTVVSHCWPVTNTSRRSGGGCDHLLDTHRLRPSRFLPVLQLWGQRRGRCVPSLPAHSWEFPHAATYLNRHLGSHRKR